MEVNKVNKNPRIKRQKQAKKPRNNTINLKNLKLISSKDLIKRITGAMHSLKVKLKRKGFMT